MSRAVRRNRTGHRMGADHHRAMATDAQAAEARRAYDTGEGGHGALARRYGLSEGGGAGLGDAEDEVKRVSRHRETRCETRLKRA